MIISSKFRTTAPNISVDFNQFNILTTDVKQKAITVYAQKSCSCLPGKRYNSQTIRNIILIISNAVEVKIVIFVMDMVTRLSLAFTSRKMSFKNSSAVYDDKAQSILSEVEFNGKCSSSFSESDKLPHSYASSSLKIIAKNKIVNMKLIRSNNAEITTFSCEAIIQTFKLP